MANKTVEYDVKFRLIKDGIEDAKKGIADINKSFGEAQDKVASIGKAFKSVTAVATAGLGLQKIFGIAKDVSQASQAIETYEVSLKNMLGTTDAARERMQEYFAIAKETPFDLQQVVEAGNKLQALGRYSADNVKMLGDLAAASGKPMEQAMSAYAKLASGQKGIAVDMFRDLMITTDDWAKATGKGVDKQGQMLATTEEMIAALPGLLKSKGYLGMMATQAQTTAGKLSNLEDGFFQLKVAIGDRLSSATKSFATEMGYAVDKVKRFVEIPVEQKIAAEKAELNALVGTLTDSNTLEAQREDALRKLNERYPDFMKNLGDEVTNTEKLKDALADANKEYDKKMKLAVYQRMADKIDSEMSEDLEDLAEYRASVSAKERIKELEPQLKSVLGSIENQARNQGFLGLDTKDFEVTSDGRVHYKEYTNQGWKTRTLPSNAYSLKQLSEAQAIQAEIDAQKEMVTFGSKIFGNGHDEANIKRLEGSWMARNAILEEYNSMIEEMMPKSQNSETTPEGSGDGNNGNPAGSGTGAIEKAAATISGGGKSVKTFNITIGSILGENTNIFQSSTDSPETAQGFLEKLSNALQMVVNDVNYAAQ